MAKRLFFYILVGCALFILLISCQNGSKNTQTRKFASQYSAIRKHYAGKLYSTKTAAQQTVLLKNKVKDLEGLLETYEKVIPGDDDEGELLKSKILIEISRFEEADKRLNRLLLKKSNLAVTIDAKMTKVQLLMARGETANALQLLKEVEPRLKKGNNIHRLTAWYYFSMYSEDVKVMKTYSEKLLAVPDLPENFSRYKGRLYRNLAALARDAQNLKEAKELLEKAIAVTAGERMKAAMDAELAQMDSIGKPVLPISADTWINSPPVSLEQLEGKAVVIVFWAPWCSACRQVISHLNEAYDTHKGKGLVVIGCTKLYGKYTDKPGSGSSEDVDKEKEIAFINEYIKRNGVIYPNSISYEGDCFEDYKITGMPTMLFVDKEGKINDVKTGSDCPQLIRRKVKILLEEINGKDSSQ